MEDTESLHCLPMMDSIGLLIDQVDATCGANAFLNRRTQKTAGIQDVQITDLDTFKCKDSSKNSIKASIF